MGGSQDPNNTNDSPLRFSGKEQSSVQYQPTSGWNIPSSQPELIGQGIERGVGNLASGLTTAALTAQKSNQQAPDYAGAAASAGKSGPVQDLSPTPEVAATKKFMRNPNYENFMDIEYPQKFSFNRYN
jgi:hypothetical protein